jgi:hemolysin D
VKGIVMNIPNDAIEDEKQGLVHRARIQLKENNSIQVGENRTELSPGMAVSAERKVIDYFLSPLKEHKNQNLSETIAQIRKRRRVYGIYRAV